MRIEQMQWLLEVGQELGKLQVENEELQADLDFMEEHKAFDTAIEVDTGGPHPGVHVLVDEQRALMERVETLAAALEGTEACNLEAIEKLEEARDKIDGLESDLEHEKAVNGALSNLVDTYRDMLAVPPPDTFNQHQLFSLLVAICATGRLAYRLGKTRYLLWSVERNRFESTELKPNIYVHTHPEENNKVRLIMVIDPCSDKLPTFEYLKEFLMSYLGGSGCLERPLPIYEGKPEEHDPLVKAVEDAMAVSGRPDYSRKPGPDWAWDDEKNCWVEQERLYGPGVGKFDPAD
jgi:hypothetical protein